MTGCSHACISFEAIRGMEDIFRFLGSANYMQNCSNILSGSPMTFFTAFMSWIQIYCESEFIVDVDCYSLIVTKER